MSTNNVEGGAVGFESEKNISTHRPSDSDSNKWISSNTIEEQSNISSINELHISCDSHCTVQNSECTIPMRPHSKRRSSSISNLGLHPYFQSKLTTNKECKDSLSPDISIFNLNDKVEQTEAFRKVINYFRDHHKGWDTPTVNFCNVNLSKETKKYINIIQDANIDFTTDLPLHLYNAYLLSTRNRNIPGFEFTAWPLPSNDLITPREYLYDTNFATLGGEAKTFNEMMHSERFTKVDYVSNRRKISPKLSMTCFWHPKIDPSSEMDECIDAIFEQNINKKITKLSRRRRVQKIDDTIIQRKDPVDLILDTVLKRRLYNKLDTVIDRMVDAYVNAEIKLSLFPTSKRLKCPVRGMDWLDVASQLDNDNDKSRVLLFRLFKHQLKKDYINGPVDKYSIEAERFSEGDEFKHKIIKGLIRKRSKFKHNNGKRNLQLLKNDLGSFLNLNLT